MDFSENKLFLVFLAIINFAVGIFSFSYYLTQLNSTHPLLWLFVADCPLYALLFGVNMLLLAGKMKLPLLGFISIIANTKFALWTLFVLLLEPNPAIYALYFVSHFLFLIEVIVLYNQYTIRLKHVLIALIWFLFNDYLDYVVGTHPAFNQQYFLLVAAFSIVSTIILVFVLSILFTKRDTSSTREIKAAGNSPKTPKPTQNKTSWPARARQK